MSSDSERVRVAALNGDVFSAAESALEEVARLGVTGETLVRFFRPLLAAMRQIESTSSAAFNAVTQLQGDFSSFTKKVDVVAETALVSSNEAVRARQDAEAAKEYVREYTAAVRQNATSSPELPSNVPHDTQPPSDDDPIRGVATTPSDEDE